MTEHLLTCRHCGRAIEDKSMPSMGSPSREFWVHYPGGYTLCEPKNPHTPLAEPDPDEIRGRN